MYGAPSRPMPGFKEKLRKYHNKPTNGFASIKEANRHAELVLLEKAGKIRSLRTQVKYVLIPRGFEERGVSYLADFVYEELLPDNKLCNRVGIGLSPWMEVVEDCKGYRTSVYILKRKLMRHMHGIKIRET